MNHTYNIWGAFFLCSAVSCNSDDGLKVYNSEPNISIQSHGMDALIQANVPIEFWAQASDLNHNPDSLVCSWQAYDADNNELASCDWGNADSEGVSRCEMTLPNSTVRVVTQVKDPADAADLDEITVSMIEDTPPQVEILNPTSDGTYYANALISFSAQLFDEEDDVADLSVIWESSIDGTLSLPMVADSTGLAEASTSLSAGEHNIRVEVEDSAGNTASDSVNIVVQEENEAPLCGIQSPNDADSFASGTMVLFEGYGTDANIPSDQLTVEWYSDKDAPLSSQSPLGTSVPNSSDGTFSFATVDLSENVHTITMIVTDDQGETCTDSVLIAISGAGVAPAIDSMSVDPNPAYNDSTLICTNAVTDPDSSYVSTYVWSNNTQGTSIGANDPYINMTSSLGMPGDSISCTLLVEDSVGQDTQAASIILSNRDPIISVVASPSTATTDELLSCTATTSDPDNENITVVYEWTNGSQVLGTSDTIQLNSSLASSGDTVTCTATATDESGASGSAWADVNILQPPFVDSVSIIPNPIYNDSNLTCSASIYDPTNTATISYSWLINGNSVGTGDALSLNSSIASPEDEITCTVDVTDGITSDQLSVADNVTNRDPIISSLAITPSSPEVNDTVTCTSAFADPDDETPIESMDWTVNGAVVGTGTTLDLSSIGVFAGDSLGCTSVVEDGYGGSDTSTVLTTIVEAGPNPQAICSVQPTTTTPPFGVATFDGSSSNDDGTIVSYEWTLIAQPTGSAESLLTPNSSTTDLVTDLAGTYTAELVVTDNDGLTGSCQVSVEAIPEEDLRVEMFWTESGDDMDLHLLPTGYWDQHGCNIYSSSSLRSEICYFSNCRASSSTGLNSIDWGVARNSSTNMGYDDDPYLDLDDISGVGPENINIEVPENTTDEYVVVVHDYSGSGDPTISNDVTVNVYLDGSLTATQTIGISGEDTYQAFFSIDYASGVVTPMFNACSGSNSSTCDDSCSFANDGYCEDITSTNNDNGWDFCASGTDCTDCASSSSTICNDTCTYSNDGVCDDGDSPNFPSFGGFDVCATGTDCTDCQ
ncbi:MAG: hypothetical protein CL916_01370 [Deltaproteobacteria bacterium]|nr:hypothetical protein [Deltaproteobacteria bacterium]